MNKKIDNGECFTAKLAYKNENGKSIAFPDENGNSRPVVVLKVTVAGKEIYYAYNVTSKIQNPFNKRNGYLVNDFKEAGFKKESIIKCDSNNSFIIEPSRLKGPFGKLTATDLEGFVDRLNLVRQREIDNEKGMER